LIVCWLVKKIGKRNGERAFKEVRRFQHQCIKRANAQ
jgi:hypothetical protein